MVASTGVATSAVIARGAVFGPLLDGTTMTISAIAQAAASRPQTSGEPAATGSFPSGCLQQAGQQGVRDWRRGHLGRCGEDGLVQSGQQRRDRGDLGQARPAPSADG